MNLSARYLYTALPFQNMDVLPAGEREAAAKVRMSCLNLIIFAENFEAAVSLFRAVRSSPKPAMMAGSNSWLFVPARDGAVTLYQIGFAHDAIRSGFKDCPTAKRFTDHAALRAQSKRFREAFPLYEQLRHSVGHAAEIMTNAKENALKEPLFAGGMALGAGTMVMNSISDFTFTQTIGGKAVSYELTETSVQTVLDIVQKTLAPIRANEPTAA